MAITEEYLFMAGQFATHLKEAVQHRRRVGMTDVADRYEAASNYIMGLLAEVSGTADETPRDYTFWLGKAGSV